MRQSDSLGQFKRRLKTHLFGLLDHSALWHWLLVNYRYRNILTYLLTYLLTYFSHSCCIGPNLGYQLNIAILCGLVATAGFSCFLALRIMNKTSVFRGFWVLKVNIPSYLTKWSVTCSRQYKVPTTAAHRIFWVDNRSNYRKEKFKI